ncbi:MAG: dCMP deaminase family protein [Bacillota bacterium]|nr:dCMP deaminase family protein [Bacillota bacterium]
MAKRNDYIDWDEYFMGVALLAAMRSKDPNTQVGACIVNRDRRILSTGYNGLPRGLSDDDFPWSRDGAWLDTKYPFVCHAELNAILNNPGTSLAGATIYTALFPCNECAKAIIQAGLAEVVYLSDKYADTDITRASRRMLETAGVCLRRLIPKIRELRLDFTTVDLAGDVGEADPTN